MNPTQVFLHPTDFSEHSQYAFRLACSLARDHDAEVIVLHVLQPATVVYDGMIAVRSSFCLANGSIP